MEAAWLSALRVAIGEKAILEAYREDTGDQWRPARTPIEQMIDDVVKSEKLFIESFTKWFNVNVWGPTDIDD